MCTRVWFNRLSILALIQSKVMFAFQQTSTNILLICNTWNKSQIFLDAKMKFLMIPYISQLTNSVYMCIPIIRSNQMVCCSLICVPGYFLISSVIFILFFAFSVYFATIGVGPVWDLPCLCGGNSPSASPSVHARPVHIRGGPGQWGLPRGVQERVTHQWYTNVS